MRMAVLGLAIAACSKSVKPLDCAWLSGMNCWKTMLQAAAACAPPKAESGSFDGRRKLCAYGGHALVSFTESVPVSPTQRQRWNFIVLSGGAACLKLEQPDERTSRLTTSAGSVTVAAAGNDEIVTCPDGTQYGANALSLLASCGEANLPGTFASGSGAVSFSLLGGASGEVQVFSCRQQ